MVDILANEQTQVLLIPLPCGDVSGSLGLTARSTADGETLAFSITTYAVAGFILETTIALPEGFHSGEWEYSLSYLDSEGNTITATGLMMATDEGTMGTQYDVDIKYKQYGE